MHRFVGTVFKVVGISFILMIILDISLVVIDSITVHNRIEAISLVIQDELSRNNAIPSDIENLFNSQINSIAQNSNVAQGIRWNLNQQMVVDGNIYPPINSQNVGNYGDILTLVIAVDMQPTRLYSYTQEYVYQVPALRYLK